MAISMDGKGRCLDNILTERWFRSLKYEGIYLIHYGRVLEFTPFFGHSPIFSICERYQGAFERYQDPLMKSLEEGLFDRKSSGSSTIRYTYFECYLKLLFELDVDHVKWAKSLYLLIRGEYKLNPPPELFTRTDFQFAWLQFAWSYKTRDEGSSFWWDTLLRFYDAINNVYFLRE